MVQDLDFLPYARQSIAAQDIEAVKTVLTGNIITRGPQVAAFERAVADYCGAQHAVAFNSGSTALRVAYQAAGMRTGDRLLTTPNSFIATTVAGYLCDAVPVFVDIDSETGNIDLDQLLANLEAPATRGKIYIAPVHYAGIPLDMCRVQSAIRDVETVVIEDAAAALGSIYPTGERVGSCAWSDLTVFSFHPAKLITTGEGGMVTTNDQRLAHRLRMLRNNGLERNQELLSEFPGPWFYEVQEASSNYNFTDFQAALGMSQLSRIDQFIQSRQQVLRWYADELAQIPQVKLLSRLLGSSVAPHLAVVKVDFRALGKTRAACMEALERSGIGTQVHYIPIYRHPVIRRLAGRLEEYFPAMEEFYDQALSLPIYSGMQQMEVQRVCRALKETLS